MKELEILVLDLFQKVADEYKGMNIREVALENGFDYETFKKEVVSSLADATVFVMDEDGEGYEVVARRFIAVEGDDLVFDERTFDSVVYDMKVHDIFNLNVA